MNLKDVRTAVPALAGLLTLYLAWTRDGVELAGVLFGLSAVLMGLSVLSHLSRRKTTPRSNPSTPRGPGVSRIEGSGGWNDSSLNSFEDRLKERADRARGRRGD